MTNALIITPDTFKRQLIGRICFLLSTQRGKSYKFESSIELGDNYINSIIVENGDTLYINWEFEGRKHKTDALDWYIEELWEIYLACEPIYQQRITDYANS